MNFETTLRRAGRRAGKDPKQGKVIRRFENGLENFDDYWTGDSDASAFDISFEYEEKHKENQTTPNNYDTNCLFKTNPSIKSMSPFSTGPAAADSHLKSSIDTPSPKPQQLGIESNGNGLGSWTKNPPGNNSAVQSFKPKKKLRYSQLDRMSKGGQSVADTAVIETGNEPITPADSEDVETAETNEEDQPETTEDHHQSVNVNEEIPGDSPHNRTKSQSEKGRDNETQEGENQTQPKIGDHASEDSLNKDGVLPRDVISKSTETSESGDEEGFLSLFKHKTTYLSQISSHSENEVETFQLMEDDEEVTMKKLLSIDNNQRKRNTSKTQSATKAKKKVGNAMMEIPITKAREDAQKRRKKTANLQKNPVGKQTLDKTVDIGEVSGGAAEQSEVYDQAKHLRGKQRNKSGNQRQDNVEVEKLENGRKKHASGNGRSKKNDQVLGSEIPIQEKKTNDQVLGSEIPDQEKKTKKGRKKKNSGNSVKEMDTHVDTHELVNDLDSVHEKERTQQSRKRKSPGMENKNKTFDIEGQEFGPGPIEKGSYLCDGDDEEMFDVDPHDKQEGRNHKGRKKNKSGGKENETSVTMVTNGPKPLKKKAKESQNADKSHHVIVLDDEPLQDVEPRKKHKSGNKLKGIDRETKPVEGDEGPIEVNKYTTRTRGKNISKRNQPVKSKKAGTGMPDVVADEDVISDEEMDSTPKNDQVKPADDETSKDGQYESIEVTPGQNFDTLAIQQSTDEPVNNHQTQQETNNQVDSQEKKKKKQKRKLSKLSQTPLFDCIPEIELKSGPSVDSRRAYIEKLKKQEKSNKKGSTRRSSKEKVTPPNGVRKSSRKKLSPVAWYQNERVSVEEMENLGLEQEEAIDDANDNGDDTITEDNINTGDPSPPKHRKVASPKKNGPEKVTRRKSVTINHAVNKTPSNKFFHSKIPRSILKKGRSTVLVDSESQTHLPTFSSSPVHYCEYTTTKTPVLPKRLQRKKVKIMAPTTPEREGLRRSRRTRVKSLAWYKGERVRYERRKSGGFAVSSIISPLSETDRRTYQRKMNAHVKKTKCPQTPRNISVHGDLPEDCQMNELQGSEIRVLNPDTNKEVYVDCIQVKESYNFIGPTHQPANTDDPLILCKSLKHNYFSAGELIIRPLQEKPMQFVRDDTLIFRIIYGKIAVTIHNTMSVLKTGDTFFVPRGNMYSLKNLRKDEAKLAFTQIKA